MSRRRIEVELSTSGLDAQGRPQRVPLVTNDGGTAVAVEPPLTLATVGVLLQVGVVVAQDPADPLARARELGARLADARGTVWSGSAVAVLTGGAGSRDATALPGRLGWTLRPHGLGLELKLRQYEQGRVFCDAVVAEAGIEGLNRVWSSPGALPSPSELTDSRRWLERVRTKSLEPAV